MSKDNFGDRMKDYENRFCRYLVRRVPVIIRLDGRSFHQWTKGLERPYDADLRTAMEYTAAAVCDEICGARFAYVQSDEISILVVDYQNEKSESWFEYRAGKIESVSASICTAAFNDVVRSWDHYKKKGWATFDSRAYNLPAEEVSNYILWRQRDAERNSISMLAQAHFSHKQLLKKSGADKQDMLMLEKGVNWNDVPTRFKRGSSIYKIKKTIKTDKGSSVRSKWIVDHDMPIVSKNRKHVERWLDADPTYPRYKKKTMVTMNI